jgi:hypothetical protein
MKLTAPQILGLFVIMGGVIAYLGDWLGRKMGKKRLRFLRLRPRHTATFFTVLMGALIPILTTYGIISSSKDVRAWLARGPELVRERDTLSNQIDAFRGNLDKLRKEFSASQTDLGRVRNERQVALREKAAAEKELMRATAELGRAAAREKAVNARVRELRDREASLTKSVAEKTRQLSEQLEKLRSSQADVRRLRTQTEDLYQNSIKLTQQIIDLEQQAEGARKAKEQAEKDKAQAEADSVRAYDTLLRIRGELMDLQGLRAGIESIRKSDLICRKGEELARLPLSGGLDATAARAQIDQLIRAAEVAARERGVVPPQGGKAAGLDDRQRLLPDGSYVKITVEDQIAAFVYEITRAKEDLVLLATSFYNCFNGVDKRVPLEINMFLNKTVYRAGDEVARATIDGKQTEEEIMEGVIAFVRTKVRDAAETAGMIPVNGIYGTIGEITFEQMSTLVRQVKLRDSKVVVIATAAKNTKSADALQLKFKVITT